MLAFTPRAAAREIEKVLRSRRRQRGGEPDCTGTATSSSSSARLRRRGPDAQALARPRARPRRRGSTSARATSRSRSRSASPTARRAAKAAAAHGGRVRREPEATERQAEARSRARRRRGRLMGQKVHPGGLRVGVIHDWKSNWWSGKKEFAGVRCSRTSGSASTSTRSSRTRGCRDILIRKDKQRITVDIYTARPGIVIGKSGVEVDALRKELHAHHPEERPHQHQRDQAPRARREARRAVDRRAAPEPRLVPARDEALARLGDPLRCAGHQDQCRRPARRLAR